MSTSPTEFAYTVDRRGEVVVTCRGKKATVLRGAAAERFLAEVESDDPQLVMARVTGNFKRGNERMARNHPRNRDRR